MAAPDEILDLDFTPDLLQKIFQDSRIGWVRASKLAYRRWIFHLNFYDIVTEVRIVDFSNEENKLKRQIWENDLIVEHKILNHTILEFNFWLDME